MPVYIGQVTSEVYSTAPVDPLASNHPASMWDEQLKIAAAVERATRDRRRTSTGDGDD